MGLLYRSLRKAVAAAVNLFYGEIEVTGTEHLDPVAPTILASNHPNSIVDPLLLGTFVERQIAFCARDGLFKIPLFGQVMRAAGAIPIRRRSDHGGATASNDDAFAACQEVLAAGGVMAIFPEGKTHGHLRIEPLKTGTARIALRAPAEVGVRVVPVGITYLVRHAFRSDVHVAFGPPIHVAEELGALAAKDEPAAVRALTGRIDDALRDLAVHIAETDDERLIAQVTSIVVGIRADEGLDEDGQSPAERTALVRRVVDAYRWMQDVDPEATRVLRERIDRYVEAREELGLGGERPVLQHRGERRRHASRGRRIAYLIAGAPLAGFGLATSMAPYLLLRLAMLPLRVSVDRIALAKLIGGFFVFGALYGVEILLVARAFGTLVSAAFGAALAPAAMFARRYAIEARLHRLGLLGLGLRGGARLAALRAERKAIAASLTVLRRRWIDAHPDTELSPAP